MRFVFTKYDSSYYILMSQNGGKNTGSGGNFSTVGKRGYWYRGLRERWRKGSKCFLLRRRSRRMVCFEWEGRRLTQGSTMLLAIYSLRYSYGSSKHRYQKSNWLREKDYPRDINWLPHHIVILKQFRWMRSPGNTIWIEKRSQTMIKPQNLYFFQVW